MTDTIKVQGRSTIRALPKGLLQRFLDAGVPYPDAVRRLAPCALFTRTVNNLVVDVGKELVADMLMDNEDVGLTYHALGTDNTAPAAGDTTLGAEAARKAWTAKIRAGSIITYSIFYLAAESTFNIKECGVFGSSTASATADSGVLFSHYLQSYDNSAGLVDLTFEYELTVG